MIVLRKNDPAKVSVVAHGVVRVSHTFLGYDGDHKKLVEVGDINWADKEPKDIDTRDHVDSYSISKITKQSGDWAALEWQITILRTSVSEFYEVRIQIIQDGFVSRPIVYRSDDTNESSKLARREFDAIIIKLEGGGATR